MEPVHIISLTAAPDTQPRQLHKNFDARLLAINRQYLEQIQRRGLTPRYGLMQVKSC